MHLPNFVIKHHVSELEFLSENTPTFIISGYGYRLFFGDFVPYLILLNLDGSVSASFLNGYHWFLFSRDRFCRWCGSKLKGFSKLGLCESCYLSPHGTRYRSIVEGCIEDNFPAHKYVVYLVSLGNLIKVGISRFDRNGLIGGFLFRLLEQGAGFFAVFDSNWNLCEAQEVEMLLSEEFGFIDRVSFMEKIELFYGDEISECEFFSIVSNVLEYTSARLIASGKFSWNVPEFDFVWEERILSGEIVGYRGNLVVFDDGSNRFSVDLSALVGRGIFSWEV